MRKRAVAETTRQFVTVASARNLYDLPAPRSTASKSAFGHTRGTQTAAQRKSRAQPAAAAGSAGKKPRAAGPAATTSAAAVAAPAAAVLRARSRSTRRARGSWPVDTWRAQSTCPATAGASAARTKSSQTFSTTPCAAMAAGPRRRDTSDAMKTQQPSCAVDRVSVASDVVSSLRAAARSSSVLRGARGAARAGPSADRFRASSRSSDADAASCERPVAAAAPATPNAGSPATPNMRSGSRTAFSTPARAAARSGGFVSPAPRQMPSPAKRTSEQGRKRLRART